MAGGLRPGGDSRPALRAAAALLLLPVYRNAALGLWARSSSAGACRMGGQAEVWGIAQKIDCRGVLNCSPHALRLRSRQS